MEDARSSSSKERSLKKHSMTFWFCELMSYSNLLNPEKSGSSHKLKTNISL